MSEPEDALAQAPLLRRLHERHPDVDLVVLPVAPPVAGEGPATGGAADGPVPVTPAALAAEHDAVAAVLAELVAAGGAAGAGVPSPADAAGDEPDREPGARTTWRTAATPGHVVPVGEGRLPVTDPDEGTAVGRAVGLRLRAGGWTGGVRRVGATVLLEAERDGRSARVAWLPGAVAVTVRGRDVPVTADTARALVTGREDV